VTSVALVADRANAAMHEDGPLLIAAFSRLHIETEVVPWGTGRDWSSFDAVLIRNTFDYVFDRDAFLAWADDVARQTRLANPAGVLRWNTDKRYLRDLEASGIPIVPTVWVEAGDPVPEVDWQEFVVKPSVSCGARLSARYRRGDEIARHVDRIHAIGAAAMVQPYLDIGPHGETGTYVFGGDVSHAISKGQVLDDLTEPREDLYGGSHQLVGPAAVDPRLAAFAASVLSVAPDVLYSRVDTVMGDDGEPVLMELEATEPYLFLEHAPEGADRFAGAVSDWLRATS
jgi:hypothetical protein